MKQSMVVLGNFLFRYRNKLFPLIIVLLFLIAVPPTHLFGSLYYENIKDVVALLIVLAGLGIRSMVLGYTPIRLGGVNKLVYADRLIENAMFKLCRNPLYVGNMFIYSGVFIMHGDPMVILLGIGSYLFIYQCIILAEEAYLRNQFGNAYDAYCQQTPRWIPQLSRFRDATAGIPFSTKRALVKGYATIASALSTVCVILLYEHIGFRSMTGHREHLLLLVAGLLLIGIAASSVRVLKKRQLLTA